MSTQIAQQQQQRQEVNPFKIMASRLQVNTDEIERLMVHTLIKAKGRNEQVTHDEVVAFMAVANEYKLNPLTKEIYGFNNRGSIQPIVSIDGWLRIINGHPQFDGLEFDDKLNDNGELVAVTARIYRKDRSRPTELTEYMAECKGSSEPWKKWPARMLRHKATIQCARYAFGLSGIIDQDEADRIEVAVAAEKGAPSQAITAQPEKPEYPQERFDEKWPTWHERIASGKQTPEAVIATVESRYTLTDEQRAAINNITADEADHATA